MCRRLSKSGQAFLISKTDESGLTFEDSDFSNPGAANAGENRDFLSAVIGFRHRINDAVTAGVDYEIPLTDEESSVMESRVNVDRI